MCSHSSCVAGGLNPSIVTHPLSVRSPGLTSVFGKFDEEILFIMITSSSDFSSWIRDGFCSRPMAAMHLRAYWREEIERFVQSVRNERNELFSIRRDHEPEDRDRCEGRTMVTVLVVAWAVWWRRWPSSVVSKLWRSVMIVFWIPDRATTYKVFSLSSEHRFSTRWLYDSMFAWFRSSTIFILSDATEHQRSAAAFLALSLIRWMISFVTNSRWILFSTWLINVCVLLFVSLIRTSVGHSFSKIGQESSVGKKYDALPRRMYRQPYRSTRNIWRRRRRFCTYFDLIMIRLFVGSIE